MFADATIFYEILFSTNPRFSVFIRQNFAHVIALGCVELAHYDFDKLTEANGRVDYTLDITVRKYTLIAITRAIEIFAHVVHGVIPLNHDLSNLWFPTPYPADRLRGPLPCDNLYLQEPSHISSLLYRIGSKQDIIEGHHEACQILLNVIEALDHLYLHTKDDPTYPWVAVLDRSQGPLFPGKLHRYAEAASDQYIMDACDQTYHGLSCNSDDRYFMELWGPDNNFHLNRPEYTKGIWNYGEGYTPSGGSSNFVPSFFDLSSSHSASQYYPSWEGDEKDIKDMVLVDWTPDPDSPSSVVTPGHPLSLSPLPDSDSSSAMSTSFTFSSSDDDGSLYGRASPPITRSQTIVNPLSLNITAVDASAENLLELEEPQEFTDISY